MDEVEMIIDDTSMQEDLFQVNFIFWSSLLQSCSIDKLFSKYMQKV